VAAEARQVQQGLIEFVGNEGGRESDQIVRRGNSVGIIDIALGSVGAGFLEALNQPGVKSIDRTYYTRRT